MEPSFWEARWAENKIGFHQDGVHDLLVAHGHLLEPAEGPRVLVPLCGKTHDLLWLRDQGADVVGVELVEKAAEDFFAEHGLAHDRGALGGLPTRVAEGITIATGDFFALDPARAGLFDAVYDRAAMIALPPPLRRRYTEHVEALLRPGGRMLLITLAYNQAAMSGPPFSVTPEEVEARYGERFAVRELLTRDVIEEEPRFQERGLRSLIERASLLTDR